MCQTRFSHTKEGEGPAGCVTLGQVMSCLPTCLFPELTAVNQELIIPLEKINGALLLLLINDWQISMFYFFLSEPLPSFNMLQYFFFSVGLNSAVILRSRHRFTPQHCFM